MPTCYCCHYPQSADPHLTSIYRYMYIYALYIYIFPFIQVELFAVFESPSCFYLVMELFPRGNLLDFVNNLGHLIEPDARRFFHQLLDIVAYLHSENICHRDIKLENLMLDSCFNLKLIGN